MGRLLSEMLRTVTFQQLADMGDDGAEVKTKEIAMLAGAIRDLSSADKIMADREFAIRREITKQAADAASKIAKRGGLSNDAVQEIRGSILGLAK